LFCWKNVGKGDGDGEPEGAGVGVGSEPGAGVAPAAAWNGIAISVALCPLGHETPSPTPSTTRYAKSTEKAAERTFVIVERVPLQFVNVGRYAVIPGPNGVRRPSVVPFVPLTTTIPADVPTTAYVPYVGV
jgi:hypothetical protein